MTLRNENIAQLADNNFDVLIVGGGINGAASALALASRGANVALIDARDFAGFSSQHSSNLIWGGIKYMENFEFGLVNELCKSRNQLIRSFPHSVREIRFLTTIPKGFRYHPFTFWMSTWLYWLFGRGFTHPPKRLSIHDIKSKEPHINTTNCQGGVEYSDAYLYGNDARFVFNFIRAALDKGCIAANYVESHGAKRNHDGYWYTTVKDTIHGVEFKIKSKILINAAGAFTDHHNALSGIKTKYRHILSKGIHLIVPRISNSKRVLAFFANDDRLFFAIPMAQRTCIGTTDTQIDSPDTKVTKEDRDFILTNINAHLNLKIPLTQDDIISERCGVRALVASNDADHSPNFHHLSRKHIIETSKSDAHISIFGGKLTNCINVGEEISTQIARLGIALTNNNKWYGEPDQYAYQHYVDYAKQLQLDQIKSNNKGEVLSDRLWRRYGLAANLILGQINNCNHKMEPIIEGTKLRRCEINHLADKEMIVTLEDLLRRRTTIEQTLGHQRLKPSPGLVELCQILFGIAAQQKLDTYFSQTKD